MLNNENFKMEVEQTSFNNPVLKCRRFLSFFQRYIVRDILLTEIYRWLIEILSAILKSTRHGGQSRERL